MTRAFVAAGAMLAVLFFTLPLTLPSSLRTRLADALGERFGGSVDVQSLRVSVLPRLRIAGEGVVVHRKSGTNLPPLISIRSFSGEAGLFGLLGSRLHIREVRLVGLEINVPPGGIDIDGDKDRPGPESGSAPVEGSTDDSGSKRPTSPIVVDNLVSEDAVLRILRGTPGKKPREFAIARLSMEDTGAETPWAFTASLTNPTPPGRIDTHGTFGPWNAGSPARTPLAAEYTFHDADLGVFKGIRGTLQSSGKFSGVLEHIDVAGEADVKDFALTSAGHAVRLKTAFHSIIDGTNGNTWLRPVDGTFRQTAVHAEGGVVEHEGADGRTVTLDVTMDRARLEDVLFLAVNADERRAEAARQVRAAAGTCRRAAETGAERDLRDRRCTVCERRDSGSGERSESEGAGRQRRAGGGGLGFQRPLRDERRRDPVFDDQFLDAGRTGHAERDLCCRNAGDGFQGNGSSRRQAIRADNRDEIDVPEGDRTGIPPQGCHRHPDHRCRHGQEPEGGSRRRPRLHTAVASRARRARPALERRGDRC
jgi:hypothetical protein